MSVKIFGHYEFNFDMPNLPDWANERICEKLRPDLRSFEYSMSLATSIVGASATIESYITSINNAARASSIFFVKVKVSSGKTEESVKAKIECFAGNSMDRVTSLIYAPRSMVLPADEKGHGYLPLFFVNNKLTELAGRSRYKSQQFTRRPIVETNLPQHLMEDLRKKLRCQLPDENVVTKWREEAEMQTEENRKRNQLNQELAKIERDENAARIAAEAIQLQKLKEKRFAKMETHAGVDIEWIKWTKTKVGSYTRNVSEVCSAANVTIRISGARTYIFLPQRNEFAVATKNVKILNKSSTEPINE